MQPATLNDEHTAPPTGEQPRRLTGRQQAQRRGEAIAGYAFIFPSILGFSLFVLYPLISSAYYALTKWNGISPPVFIGFQNFVYMFTKDPSFWPSIRATLIFVALSVPLTIILGLLLAMLLNRALPAVRLFRTIFYLPTVLPIVATLTLWKFIFNPQFGIANAALKALHLSPSLWLGGEQTALPTLVLIGLWGVGSTMIIFLAALQSVPQELYEAGALDGAGRSRLFSTITLPLITPVIFLQLIMQIIAALQEFNRPKILTGGGPNNATNFFFFKIYANGFGALGNNPDLGYAIAQVWILFLLIMIATFFTFRLSSMWVYEESSLD